MNFDGIIAARGNDADRARALVALYDLFKACAAERDRCASMPGIWSRKTRRQRAAFADYEIAREWVTAAFDRIKVLEGWPGSRVQPTSA